MTDFETTMEEGGVLPKPKASERDYLMDFKPVTAQFECSEQVQGPGQHLPPAKVQRSGEEGCDELERAI